MVNVPNQYVSYESLNEILKEYRAKLLESGIGGGGSGESVQISINQAKHGLSVYTIVRINEYNRYVVADASSMAKAQCVGVVSKVMDENNFVLTICGLVKGMLQDTSLPEGYLYLGVDGNLYSIPTTIRVVVGYKTEEGFVVRIEEPKNTDQKTAGGTNVDITLNDIAFAKVEDVPALFNETLREMKE